jgi:hypothetical protein
MKSIKLSSCLGLLYLSSACGVLQQSGSELNLNAYQPRTGQITFEALPKAVSDNGYFNEILVYETGSCEIPKCRVMWHVLVPDKSGPKDFVYGGIPTFGSQTIVPAHRLRANRSYLLVVGASEVRFEQSSGELAFGISDQGQLALQK